MSKMAEKKQNPRKSEFPLLKIVPIVRGNNKILVLFVFFGVITS